MAKKKTAPIEGLIRDRIKEFRRVPASELIQNPKNWRTHSQAQRKVLEGLLGEIGFASAVLARETPVGLMLIDGHLRRDASGNQPIPVLILDVTESEADKILVTLDPLAAMAGADAQKLDDLMRDVQTESQDVAQMLTELAKEHDLIGNPDERESTGNQEATEQFCILITCKTESEQLDLLERLKSEGHECRSLIS